MSLEVMAWALEQNIQPAGRKLVLLAIGDYTSFDGDGFIDHLPRVEVLAEWTSMSAEEIEKQIRALLRSGVIRLAENRERRAGK
jgi:hypothetical protein